MKLNIEEHKNLMSKIKDQLNSRPELNTPEIRSQLKSLVAELSDISVEMELNVNNAESIRDE